MDTGHSNIVIHRIDRYMLNRFLHPAPRVVILDLGTYDKRVAIVWVRVSCEALGHSLHVPVRHWAVPKECGEEFPCIVVGDAVWDAALGGVLQNETEERFFWLIVRLVLGCAVVDFVHSLAAVVRFYNQFVV